MNGGRTGGAGLACSILILALLGGVLALTAGHDSGRPSAPVASEAAPPADEPPESLSSREITRIAVAATPTVAHRVEKIRGLKFDHIPKPEVVSADYLNHLGVKEGGGLSGIGVGEAEGRMTGLLKPNEELENAYGSTGDLAAAAYDPETERLYIVRDTTGVPNRALIEYLLSHELDHALEDQNFGIGGGGKLDTDASLARQAMIEGLATSVMQDYATDYLNPIDLLAGASGIDTGNHGVPQFLVDELTWTYLGGQDWIDALRDVGQGWKLVDYALGSRPPVSTEQILHPIKYLAEETPDEVEIDDTELRDSDLNLADRAGLGERQTQDLLKVGASDSLADLAAEGWNGDSYELWREPGTKLRDCADPCRTGLVLIIRWSWDSKKGPGEFDRAARAYIGGGLGGKPVAPGVWSLGPTAVATGSAGNTSALVFAPDEAQARRLVNAQLQGSAP